jgi:hypothetical protein
LVSSSAVWFAVLRRPRWSAVTAGAAVAAACTMVTGNGPGHRRRGRQKRLSEALGEQAWRASGLGAPDDVDALKQRIVTVEPQVVDLRLQLEERDDELAAARAANRELITRLNTMT